MVKKLTIVSLMGIGRIGIGFLICHQHKKSVVKKNNTSSKKVLANQIKEDLQKDLEKVQKGSTSHHLTYVNRPWAGCDIPCGEERFIVLFSPDAPENKGKRNLITPSELEKDDYDEIVSLIKQVNTTREKVSKQKQQEWDAKIDQKLSGNSKKFYYEGKWEWEDYDDIRHFFRGIENSQKSYLVFPENHPATSFLPKSYNPLQQNGFYQIEEVGKLPFQPEKKLLHLHKEANLTYKITIIAN
ncbi:MAG: hypothetical protein MRERC_5c61 [Mycoplasmataceae bacterium RC_NB112A]|nr:MAG: hypothetical protein MRERC_5c61 [Mycoplasmataceae bacterium RC_NB112A]